MFRKIIYGLVLVSICLSLVAGAEARSVSAGSGPKPIMNTDLGSGR